MIEENCVLLSCSKYLIFQKNVDIVIDFCFSVSFGIQGA